MSAKIIGAVSGVEAEVDGNRNLQVDLGLDYIGATGGHYTVAGGAAAVVAAALAANTMIMSMRLSAGSARQAYLVRFRLVITPATLGAAAGVAGTLGLIRFTAQTPTGGTARTPNRQAEALGSASDITDIRDSNAALTGTAPTFGTVVSNCLVPLFVANAGGFEWIYEPSFPTILRPGDGLALRTIVQMAATQTWLYSYTAHWFEK